MKFNYRKWLSYGLWGGLAVLCLFFLVGSLSAMYQKGRYDSDQKYWIVSKTCENGKIEPREIQTSSIIPRSVYFVCVQK